jgi:hypothetical protein
VELGFAFSLIEVAPISSQLTVDDLTHCLISMILVLVDADKKRLKRHKQPLSMP